MEESASVPIEKVAFEREWTFWENYETKERDKNIDWSALLKSIFTFSTIIDFWHFGINTLVRTHKIFFIMVSECDTFLKKNIE